MHRRTVLLHLLILSTVITPLRAADPVFESESGHRCMIELLKKSSWGLGGQFERAAFLIEHEDGTLDCSIWPPTYAFRSETFFGKMPHGTIAILHTHPQEIPRPSAEDIQLASQLGVPNYVITIRGVMKAMPGTEMPLRVTSGYGWFRRQIPMTASAAPRVTIRAPAATSP